MAFDALSAAAYGINVRLAVLGTDYLSAELEPSPLQHFWSLAVEEQFYFVWPLLLVVAAGRSRRTRSAAIALSLLGVVSFAVCVWQTGHSQPWAYFGIQARAWELAAGALVALAAERLRNCQGYGGRHLARPRRHRRLGPAVRRDDPLPRHGGAAAGRRGGPRHRRWLRETEARRRPPARHEPMQAIGKLSYSWYLWHWPALMLAPHIAGEELGTWTRAAVAVASLIPAWLSLRLVENRVRFNPVFKRRPRRGLGLGATLTALACGAAAIFLGLPNEVRGEGTAQDTAAALAVQNAANEEQQLAAARKKLLDLIETERAADRDAAEPDPARHRRDQRPAAGVEGLPRLAGRDVDQAGARQGCDKHGDPQGTATMVLFGDSHTEQWFDAVDAVAKRRHQKLVVLTKSGCTPADAYTIKVNARRAFTECATWREEAFTKIKELKPALVLMSTRTYTDPPVDKAGAVTVGKAEADGAWADGPDPLRETHPAARRAARHHAGHPGSARHQRPGLRGRAPRRGPAVRAEGRHRRLRHPRRPPTPTRPRRRLHGHRPDPVVLHRHGVPRHHRQRAGVPRRQPRHDQLHQAAHPAAAGGAGQLIVSRFHRSIRPRKCAMNRSCSCAG